MGKRHLLQHGRVTIIVEGVNFAHVGKRTADDEPVSGASVELVVDPLAESIIYLCNFARGQTSDSLGPHLSAR
jgi:hypothetical protein